MHIPIFDERTRLGELRYALARSSRWKGRVHLTLVVAVREPTWAAELLRRLQRGGTALESAFLSFNATPGNVLLGAQVRSVFGPRSLIERLGVLELESTPNAFLQANPAVAERVYENAARWLQIGSTEEVLDVYCGVGAIGLTVCGDAQRLLGIEASPAAIDCAGRNARRLRRPLARFVTGRAEDLLSIAHAHEMTPSTVLLNPPRRGLGPGVVDALAALGPRQIAYVSCDPTSLARDLTALAERGFEPTRVRLFDMLPQTLHVEALALLVRRASASKAPTAKPGTRTDRTRRRAQRRVP
jgi:23S rRNA (uracil1939-C5)-methyltransferase